MPDIISIGEVLIDFISNEPDINLTDVSTFIKFPGGAPANVVVVAASLGAKAGLISCVGKDPLGNFLFNTLQAKGVDTSQIMQDEEHHTGVVFVELKKAKPKFMLYTNVAYNFMQKTHLNKEYIQNAKVLNFGSVTLLMEPSRGTTLESINLAKGHCTISCDVNFRIDIWKNKIAEMWEIADKVLIDVDILKLGEDEALEIGKHLNPAKKEPTLDDALLEIYQNYDPKLIAVTMGGKGSRFLLIREHKINMDIKQGVYKVVARDTVGAGDAFFGSLLYMLLKMDKLQNLDNITEAELKKIMTFSNTFKSEAKRS